ncbi:unnamed protein product, partial [marine sediment metagenome]
LYAASDPDALYTSPGVEGSVRDRMIECQRRYITLSGGGCDVVHAASDSIYVRAVGGSRLYDVIVQDFYVHDSQFIDNAHSVNFVNVQDTTVRRVEVSDAQWNGINFSVFEDGGATFTGNVVDQVYSHDNGHTGMNLWHGGDASAATGTIVRHSVFHGDSVGIYAANVGNDPGEAIGEIECL